MRRWRSGAPFPRGLGSLARDKKWTRSQQELAALRRRGKSNLAALKRRGGAPHAFATGTHRQAGARFSSSRAESGLTVSLSWNLNPTSGEPIFCARVSLTRLWRLMARQGALFSLHAGSERRELSATPIPAQFLGARNCQGASRLRCHPRRDQGGKGRAVSLGDETAFPSLQFSFLRPFWSQRSTFKLSFDVKHASLVDRHGAI